MKLICSARCPVALTGPFALLDSLDEMWTWTSMKPGIRLAREIDGFGTGGCHEAGRDSDDTIVKDQDGDLMNWRLAGTVDQGSGVNDEIPRACRRRDRRQTGRNPCF